MSITLRELLGILAGAPFWSDAKFWVTLFNVIVIFSQRFQFNFTAEEIAAVNLFIAVIFGVAPPTVNYIQQRAYEAKVKSMERNAGQMGEFPKA